MKIKKSVLITILLIAGLSMSACRGVAPKSNESRLRERVQGYILARQKSDLAKLQSYFINPGAARMGNIKYIKSEIVAINMDENSTLAEVKLKNNIQAMGFTFKDIPQLMKWSWEKGDWRIQSAANKSNPFKNGSARDRVQDVNQLKQ